MIVSHAHKFIFLKTTKTASTSIEIALSQHCGPNDVITPILPEDEAIRQSLGFRGPQKCDVPLSSYGLRDWARLLGTGTRRKFRNHTTAQQAQVWLGKHIWEDYFVFCFERNPYDKAISRYFWSTRDKPQDIDEFLRTVPLAKLSNWHIYSIGNEVGADFVGRYERLNEDLAYVWSRLKLPGEPTLPRAKSKYRRDRRHYSEVLSAAARARIEEVCKRELQQFDYHYEAAPRGGAVVG